MIPLSALIEDSGASAEAKSKGLKHVGWGKYADSSGKVVAKSENGKLVWLKTGLGTGKPRRRPKKYQSLPAEEKKVHLTIEHVPTKQNPTFEELGMAANQHTFTINSRKPVGRVVDNVPEQASGWKPKGIWFGVKSSWVGWLEHEMPQWKGDYLYSLEIDTTKCLVIKDEVDLLDFTKKYGRTREGWPIQSDTELDHANIEWRLVAYQYSGIIIPQYFNRLRLDLMWYYPWDVASGCIWDVTCIKSVKQVPIR